MKPAEPLKQCLIILLCFGTINAYSQSISGVVNTYYQVTAVNPASNTVTVNNSSGLTPKTRVLLIQMKGASITGNNNATFGGGNDFALDDISFNKVCTLTDTVKILANIPPTIQLPRDTFLCNSVNVIIAPTVNGKPTPTLAWQNGSSTTTLSLWMINVFAVPKSIAISWVKKLNNPAIYFI